MSELALPRALASWAPLLAELPQPAASVIIPWLAPVERLLAPYLTPRPEAAGPPDGFGALARRGPYERLLLSEWLLWQELPDEFMRRAAAGEHLFQAVVRKQPSGRSEAVVLFDVGPDQIGAPRLAQIALLAVLARRAAVDGTVLGWGALQHPHEGLFTGLGPADLRRFLAWRTEQPADDEQQRLWRLIIGGGAETIVWTVGGPARARAARGVHVEIREPDGPGTSALTVRVTAASGLSPVVSLALPPTAAQVEVLRGEPASGSARLAGLALRDVAFSPVGERLFVLRRSRRLDAWWIPRRPTGALPSSRSQQLPADETLLAAGWQKRRFVVVTAAGTRVRVRGIQRNHRNGLIESRNLHRLPVPETELVLPGWVEPNLDGVLFLDGERTLLRLHTASTTVAAVATRVRAAAWSGARLMFLRETDGGLAMAVLEAGVFQHGADLPPAFDDGPMFAARVPSAPHGALFAYRGGPAMWRLTTSAGPVIELHPSSGAEVVGAAILNGHPALLLLEAGGQTLSLVGRHSVRHIHTSPGRILAAATSPLGDQFLVVTAAAVSVIDREGQLLLELPRTGDAEGT